LPDPLHQLAEAAADEQEKSDLRDEDRFPTAAKPWSFGAFRVCRESS
jgi:hypothetical protein